MGADGANPSWNEARQPHLLHDSGHCADLDINDGNSQAIKKVQKQGLDAIVGWMAEWKPTSN